MYSRKRAAGSAAFVASITVLLVVGLLNMFGLLHPIDLIAVPLSWLIAFVSWFRFVRGQKARG